jgi:lipopolysaccharide export system ATP-binding protein
MAAAPLLDVTQLTTRFGDRTALDQVSLCVRAGEIVGVLGRNGAGKTTLLQSVMGLLRPDEGQIRLRGEAQFVPRELSRDEQQEGTWSGAEIRRRMIGKAMGRRPGLLVLDEPMSGVDPLRVQELQALLRDLARQGTGILFSDHNARESLGLCDRAYVLHEGRIVAKGTPGDLSKG